MDFNGDGVKDILSGCYHSDDPDAPKSTTMAGYLQILQGNGEQDFAAAEFLRDTNDRPLVNVQPGQYAETEEDDSGSFDDVVNICVSQHAVDYDGDGDLDLVTGAFDNQFYLHRNVASTAEETPQFKAPAVKLEITSPDQHSNPHLVDWDGDGDLDLVSGGSSGGVFLSINKGSTKDPKWGEFEQLISGESRWEQEIDSDSEIQPGHGTRVWVTDFNQDGKMDLLVGDSTTLKQKVEGISDEEFERKKAELKRLSAPLSNKLRAIQSKFQDRLEAAAKTKDKEALQTLFEEMQDESSGLYEELSDIQNRESEFIDSQTTGHVWLYLQQ